jgi:SAM-dependent methyltransferase
MTPFGEYSAYYDVLYQDKDYPAESSYVIDLIRRSSTRAKEIVDFGCGTGTHALLLSEAGYEVTGVDRSEAMLQIAQTKFTANQDQCRVKLVKGDIREIRLGRTFDVAVSLFHVLSYQTKNDDVINTIRTFAKHLPPGGLLIFDFWYGPAVLTLKPETRVKRLTKDNLKITRISEPQFLSNENCVDVHYTLVSSQPDGSSSTITEVHSMRYFFEPELRFFLAICGFHALHFYEWLTFSEPKLNSWGVVCAAQRTLDKG